MNYKKYNERKLIGLIAVFAIGVFLGSVFSGYHSISGLAIKGDSKLTECNDNIDNDGDNKIDYPNDPDCQSQLDNSESDEDCASK